MQVDFSRASGEDTRLALLGSAEDEEEMEDALHSLPRKDGKADGHDSL